MHRKRGADLYLCIWQTRLYSTSDRFTPWKPNPWPRHCSTSWAIEEGIKQAFIYTLIHIQFPNGSFFLDLTRLIKRLAWWWSRAALKQRQIKESWVRLKIVQHVLLLSDWMLNYQSVEVRSAHGFTLPVDQNQSQNQLKPTQHTDHHLQPHKHVILEKNKSINDKIHSDNISSEVCCNVPLHCHLGFYTVKSRKLMRCMDITAALALISYEVMNNHKLPDPIFLHPQTDREP